MQTSVTPSGLEATDPATAPDGSEQTGDAEPWPRPNAAGPRDGGDAAAGPRAGADAAAAAILENVPLIMRSIHGRMREGRPAGMSVAQFRTLLYLRRHPGSGLSEIADHLGTSVPAASELVSRLVRQELVERETDPVERRRIRLTLSATGTSELDQAQWAAMAWLRNLVQDLDPERQRAIADALADLRRLILAADEPAESEIASQADNPR
jgi:DNA-binding MarR family transcriptional regulator